MGSTTYISESVTRKVSLVVLAIDDFTGKPILGSNIRVTVDGASRPIKKSEGYHVFLDLNMPFVTVRAEGGRYHPRVVVCDLTPSEENYTMLKIRMVPNRAYQIPQNTTCVEGKALPGSLIRIFCRDSGAYKLLYDYSSGENSKKIHIFHPSDVEMDGKLFYISSGEDAGEFLRVTGICDQESKEYLLETALTRDYKKIGTSLLPAYETAADVNGTFFIPIPNTYRDKNNYICEASGEKTVRHQLELKTGKINKIDLR